MSTGVVVNKKVWIVLWCLASAAVNAQDLSRPGLTLKEVLQLVRVNNRDVSAAKRMHDAAVADARTAAVTPAPVLSVNMQQIDPGHLGRGSLWARPVDTVIRVEQTVERGGKAQWRAAVSRVAEEAAALDVREVLREQQVQASQAYWDLKAAEQQWRIAVDNESLAKSSSDLARVRLAQGDLSRLDATRLEVEAQRADNDRDVALQQVRVAQAALARLIGRRADDLSVADPWPVVTDATPLTRSLPVLAARPDLEAAQKRVEQARAALSLAEAQRSADVTVGLQFEHVPPSGERWWGVGLSVPLGVDSRQDGPVQRAQIDLANAEADRDRLQEQAQAERATQWQGMAAAIQRVVRIERDLLPQAREAAQSADYAREQGALSLQDVLDARRTLHAVELDAAGAHADLARAMAALGLLKEQESGL
ncbi:MAG: TolC family protein [Burkholderiales bacterium]|nr:TolC family protein [Burkholderiales bacterium]